MAENRPSSEGTDPLASAEADARRAIEDAEARLRAIEDAPSFHAHPPIPTELTKPIPRPVKQPSTTASLSRSVSDLGKSLAIGLDFLWMLVAGAFLGWLVDRWLGKGQVGILVGLGLGFVVGTWRLLRRLNADDRTKSIRSTRGQ